MQRKRTARSCTTTDDDPGLDLRQVCFGIALETGTVSGSEDNSL